MMQWFAARSFTLDREVTMFTTSTSMQGDPSTHDIMIINHPICLLV